jgi:hypothetical protein
MRFLYIHCSATDVFSVLWSDLRLYKEKPTIIVSSVQLQISLSRNDDLAREKETLCVL